MNEAEQTSRLHSMTEKELAKWEKHFIRDIAEIQDSIDRTDRDSIRDPQWKADNDATNSRRRARKITRQRRLAQIQRRLAEVRSGAPLATTPAPVDKESQRVWRRLVADRREAMQYLAYAQKREDKRGLAVFQAKVDRLDEKMREIAEAGKTEIGTQASDGFVADTTLAGDVVAAIAEHDAQPVAPVHEHTYLANGVADCCACCDDVRAGRDCQCGEMDAMRAEAAEVAAAEAADLGMPASASSIIRYESAGSLIVNCTCGNDVCCDGFDVVQADGTPATPDLGEYWDGSLQCGTCKVIMVPAEAVQA